MLGEEEYSRRPMRPIKTSRLTRTKISSSCEEATVSMLPTVAIDGPTYRLIPSRYPPISAFDAVTSADDLEAVMELDGWTNDRLGPGRLAGLGKAEEGYR